MKIYTVYDSKVEAYMSPFCQRSKGEALRAWETAVNDEQTQFCKFPADFTLFEIGEFDDNTGVITPHKTHMSMGLALDFKRKPATQLPLLADPAVPSQEGK